MFMEINSSDWAHWNFILNTNILSYKLLYHILLIKLINDSALPVKTLFPLLDVFPQCWKFMNVNCARSTKVNFTHLLKKMISIISLTNFFITLCGVVLFKTNKQSWLQISSFTNSPGRLVLYVSETNKTMVLCIMTTVLTIGAQAGWHSRQRYLLIFVKHANH